MVSVIVVVQMGIGSIYMKNFLLQLEWLRKATIGISSRFDICFLYLLLV